MKFAMLLLVCGVLMFTIPLGCSALERWSWFYLPIVGVGVILIIGGIAEGT